LKNLQILITNDEKHDAPLDDSNMFMKEYGDACENIFTSWLVKVKNKERMPYVHLSDFFRSSWGLQLQKKKKFKIFWNEVRFIHVLGMGMETKNIIRFILQHMNSSYYFL
jgi:hypothetical protein